MTKEETALISVQPYTMSDTIYVLIPPKLWAKENLAEMVKRAIAMTFGERSEWMNTTPMEVKESQSD